LHSAKNPGWIAAGKLNSAVGKQAGVSVAQRPQNFLMHKAGEADSQSRNLAGMHGTGREDDFVPRLHCLYRIRNHHLSGGCDAHTVMMAHEYLNPDSVLKVFDLLAE